MLPAEFAVRFHPSVEQAFAGLYHLQRMQYSAGITKEMLEKALECETAEQLIALVKAEGFTLTKEEAEAYMAEMDNMELDEDALDNVAGGMCYSAGLGSNERCNRGGGIAGA